MTDQQPRYTPVGLYDFIGTDLVEPRWAVEGIWPEGANGVIAGKPKGGKSSLAAELAISLWSGRPMFGLDQFPTRRGQVAVLLIQQENADPRVQRDLQQIMAARELGTITTYPTFDAAGQLVDSITHFDPSMNYWQNYIHDDVPIPEFHMLSNRGFNVAQPDDQDWLTEYIRAHGIRYLILDPLYMLVGSIKISDGGDELRPVLTWLSKLRADTGCASIITHHLTDKDGAPNDATALLGTTYIHAWYEAALLTRRNDAAFFTIQVDALRDFSMAKRVSLQGEGVGRWFYSEVAQGQEDATGRPAPAKSEVATRQTKIRQLRASEPGITKEALAEAFNISVRTIERDLKEIAAEDAANDPLPKAAP